MVETRLEALYFLFRNFLKIIFLIILFELLYKIHYLPKDTGYPIGGNTDYNFILVEIHYQSHHSKRHRHRRHKLSYIDSLTLRYFYTDVSPKHELGVLKLGAESDPIGILIPPYQQSFKITSICSNECFRQV